MPVKLELATTVLSWNKINIYFTNSALKYWYTLLIKLQTHCLNSLMEISFVSVNIDFWLPKAQVFAFNFLVLDRFVFLLTDDSFTLETCN